MSVNPLSYTGQVFASTTRAGICQFNPQAFTVSDTGVVDLAGSGGGAVQTINSLNPTAGNIIVAGTANQLTVGSAGSTVTLSLPAAITAPGSLTTTTTLAATTTITAGTGITSTTGNISATAGQLNAGTTMTAGTGITATTGNITATAGNVILNGAGTQLRVHGGAVTDFIGQATLAAGTVTVANTNIAAGDKIFISRSAINGSTALGMFTYTISAATSFTITSVQPGTPGNTETNDISIIQYVIVRQV